MQFVQTCMDHISNHSVAYLEGHANQGTLWALKLYCWSGSIYPCNDTIATGLATQFTPTDSDTPNEG